MDYNILEARIEFDTCKLKRITVLVDCSTGPYIDVRAIYATSKPTSGYKFISETEELSDALLQEVAATGVETVDRDEIFPNWKKKYKKILPNG